ncbi:MAG: type II toxin-antitoxin system VapC family toxin [Bacteroidales bacterium]|nr:type II toxin-antitoxin system VapC family toxin [Bacteroidales bacterium]MCF8454669.1 type II toxin-antitoxin system VapC family toxin [Bacteroidales bacterium]
MADQVILLDTSILIDFFRKKNKRNSTFYSLSTKYSKFAVSTITRFEIYAGQTDSQDIFWIDFYKRIEILDFDDNCALKAGEIVKQLRRDNKMIEISDVLIASTAIANNLQVATLNIKHFNRIENLKIVSV